MPEYELPRGSHWKQRCSQISLLYNRTAITARKLDLANSKESRRRSKKNSIKIQPEEGYSQITWGLKRNWETKGWEQETVSWFTLKCNLKLNLAQYPPIWISSWTFSITLGLYTAQSQHSYFLLSCRKKKILRFFFPKPFRKHAETGLSCISRFGVCAVEPSGHLQALWNP